MYLILFILSCLYGIAPLCAKVNVSLHPLSLVVSTISRGVLEVGAPLVKGHGHHGIHLTPKQCRDVVDSDIFVWIGEEMEGDLGGLLSIIPSGAELKLSSISEVRLIATRRSDWHIWLNPEAMLILARHLADILIEKSPHKEECILKNIQAFEEDCQIFKKNWGGVLSGRPVAGYFMVHNAIGHLTEFMGAPPPSLKLSGHAPSPFAIKKLAFFIDSKGPLSFIKILGEDSKGIENFLESRSLPIHVVDVMGRDNNAESILVDRKGGLTTRYFLWLESLASQIETALTLNE